jgi:hypothetical protein
MTQALQLLTVVAVGAALALYGHFKGLKERLTGNSFHADKPEYRETNSSLNRIAFYVHKLTAWH